jgi:hypothetical protein
MPCTAVKAGKNNPKKRAIEKWMTEIIMANQGLNM